MLGASIQQSTGGDWLEFVRWEAFEKGKGVV